jgi:outer membrane biogenesis lipoprotein LolB
MYTTGVSTYDAAYARRNRLTSLTCLLLQACSQRRNLKPPYNNSQSMDTNPIYKTTNQKCMQNTIKYDIVGPHGSYHEDYSISGCDAV